MSPYPMAFCQRFYFSGSRTVIAAVAFFTTSSLLGGCLILQYSKKPRKDDYDVGRRIIFPIHIKLLVFFAGSNLMHSTIRFVLIDLLTRGKFTYQGYAFSVVITVGFDHIPIGTSLLIDIMNPFIYHFRRGNGCAAVVQRHR